MSAHEIAFGLESVGLVSNVEKLVLLIFKEAQIAHDLVLVKLLCVLNLIV